MAETIRAINIRKFSVGIRLQNGIEHNIAPGSFITLKRDDVDYLGSIAPALFQGEGILVLSDREVSVENGFIDSLENAPLDREEIAKHLQMGEKKLRAWLQGITEPYLLDEIYNVARTMDLTAGKLKALAEKMPERDFLDTGEPSAGEADA